MNETFILTFSQLTKSFITINLQYLNNEYVLYGVYEKNKIPENIKIDIEKNNNSTNVKDEESKILKTNKETNEEPLFADDNHFSNEVNNDIYNIINTLDDNDTEINQDYLLNCNLSMNEEEEDEDEDEAKRMKRKMKKMKMKMKMKRKMRQTKKTILLRSKV